MSQPESCILGRITDCFHVTISALLSLLALFSLDLVIVHRHVLTRDTILRAYGTPIQHENKGRNWHKK